MSFLRQLWSYKLFFGLCVGMGVWLAMFLAYHTGNAPMFVADFYPLYVAGQALLAGENPYGQSVIDYLVQNWDAAYAIAGFAYPMPILVILLPLFVLPYWVALTVWVVFGVLSSSAAIFLQKNWRFLFILPLCFAPLYDATVMAQATLVWFGFVVLLLLGMQANTQWLVGLCIALLPAKPQTGILFVIVALVWIWKNKAWTALVWALVATLVFWGGSFVFRADWVIDWFGSLRLYDQVVYTKSFLPWCLLLIPATWHLPWYARLAVVQTLLFPITSLYSLAPLLLVWVAIASPVAYFGCVLSWLIFLLDLPFAPITFVMMVILPLFVCAIWDAWQFWSAKLGLSQIQAS